MIALADLIFIFLPDKSTQPESNLTPGVSVFNFASEVTSISFFTLSYRQYPADTKTEGPYPAYLNVLSALKLILFPGKSGPLGLSKFFPANDTC